MCKKAYKSTAKHVQGIRPLLNLQMSVNNANASASIIEARRRVEETSKLLLQQQIQLEKLENEQEICDKQAKNHGGSMVTPIFSKNADTNNSKVVKEHIAKVLVKKKGKLSTKRVQMPKFPRPRKSIIEKRKNMQPADTFVETYDIEEPFWQISCCSDPEDDCGGYECMAPIHNCEIYHPETNPHGEIMRHYHPFGGRFGKPLLLQWPRWPQALSRLRPTQVQNMKAKMKEYYSQKL